MKQGQCSRFTLNGQLIQQENTTKYLGVHPGKRLAHPHVELTE